MNIWMMIFSFFFSPFLSVSRLLRLRVIPCCLMSFWYFQKKQIPFSMAIECSPEHMRMRTARWNTTKKQGKKVRREEWKWNEAHWAWKKSSSRHEKSGQSQLNSSSQVSHTRQFVLGFTFFHTHASLLTFFVCFFILFHSCCSNAQVFGKTLVHEFPISYSHSE